MAAKKKTPARKKAPAKAKKAPAKRAPKKAAAPKGPSRDRLETAAEDLNEVMGLEGRDFIEIEDVTVAQLTKSITTASKLIEKGDVFNEDTDAVLTELGLFEEEAPKKAKAPASKTKAPAKKGAKKEPKEPRVTKKSVVIEMVSKRGGATADAIGQAIADKGIDPDVKKNTSTAKLWMRKLGFEVKLNEKTGKYVKV